MTLRFREFNLINEVEVLEVYDGAGMDAPFLARYTGISVPDDITASGREVRLVYRAELKQTAAEIWEAIRSDLGAGHLQPAVNRFLTAARFRTTGFHGMDIAGCSAASRRRCRSSEATGGCAAVAAATARPSTATLSGR